MAFAVSSAIRAEIVERNLAGEGGTALAAEYGIGVRTVQRYVSAVVGKRPYGGQRRYSFDEGAFSILDAETAYWLGVLLADGSIREGRGSPSLRLGMKDREHVAAFRRMLARVPPPLGRRSKLKKVA